MAYLRGLDKGEKCQKQTNTSEAQLKNDMLCGGGGRGLIFPLLVFLFFFFPPDLSNYDIPFLTQLNTSTYCPLCAAQIHCQDTRFFFLGHRRGDLIPPVKLPGLCLEQDPVGNMQESSRSARKHSSPGGTSLIPFLGASANIMFLASRSVSF